MSKTYYIVDLCAESGLTQNNLAFMANIMHIPLFLLICNKLEKLNI